LTILTIVLICAVIVFIINKRKLSPNVVYRLSWFELQICPDSSRYAALPMQPILLYKEPINAKEKGAVLLIRKEGNPVLYDKVYDELDKLIQKAEILSLPQQNPEMCFSDEGVKSKSIHFRFRYADNRQWASVYPLDAIPTNISSLINACKQLTLNSIGDEAGNTIISGSEAMKHLEEASKAKDKYRDDLVCKIKLASNGDIYLNGKIVSINQLSIALNDLKSVNGTVWYYRENPAQEPPKALISKMQNILDEIAKRNLPIKLSESDFNINE
jgi:hypothetical protein